MAGPGTPLPSQLPQGKPYENLGSRPPDLNQTAKLVRVEFGPDLPPPTRKYWLDANFIVQSTVGRKQNMSARRARSADVGPINPPKAETAPTSASTDHPVDPPHLLGCRRGQGQASEARKSDCPKQRPPAANFGSNGSTRAPTAEQPRKAHPDMPPWGALVRTLEASSPTSPPFPNGSINRTCPGLAFQKTTGKVCRGVSLASSRLNSICARPRRQLDRFPEPQHPSPSVHRGGPPNRTLGASLQHTVV